MGSPQDGSDNGPRKSPVLPFSGSMAPKYPVNREKLDYSGEPIQKLRKLLMFVSKIENKRLY